MWYGPSVWTHQMLINLFSNKDISFLFLCITQLRLEVRPPSEASSLTNGAFHFSRACLSLPVYWHLAAKHWRHTATYRRSAPLARCLNRSPRRGSRSSSFPPRSRRPRLRTPPLRAPPGQAPETDAGQALFKNLCSQKHEEKDLSNVPKVCFFLFFYWLKYHLHLLFLKGPIDIEIRSMKGLSTCGLVSPTKWLCFPSILNISFTSTLLQKSGSCLCIY